MALPKNLTWPMANTQWPQQLDPIIANPLVNGRLITGQQLINGTTPVNHGLSRKLQGWFIVDIDTGLTQTIYRTLPDVMPDKILNLVSNAACTVALWVF